MTLARKTNAASASQVRIGFVPLLDAAPIIAAEQLGYFADEGLRVLLERQIGWGNVRDKLTFGHLQASHALLGMPPLSVVGRDRFLEPLATVISLGYGGNAITVSRRLSDRGIDSATSFAACLRQRHANEPPARFAHVFGCSTHHYLLRDWLGTAEIDADRDVQLCVLPPPQMVGQMAKGYLDGFCVGEPWNTHASVQGCGAIVAMTTDLVPAHPEKVLAVARQWLNEHPQVAQALVRAILRAVVFCADGNNQSRLIQMLSRSEYLAVAPTLLAKSLALGTRRGSGQDRFYGVSPASAYPNPTHAAWILTRMQRCHHLDADVDVRAAALACTQTDYFRAAAQALQLAIPTDDSPPMRLRGGWFQMPQPAPLIKGTVS